MKFTETYYSCTRDVTLFVHRTSQGTQALHFGTELTARLGHGVFIMGCFFQQVRSFDGASKWGACLQKLLEPVSWPWRSMVFPDVSKWHVHSAVIEVEAINCWL